MIENMNREELARLAKLFRQYASETRNPEFQAKFLKTAEEIERALDATPGDGQDKTPR